MSTSDRVRRWAFRGAFAAAAFGLAATGLWGYRADRDSRGLIWPALGWMAITLFALISLRNAAPGAPPIGSLIDYTAFFWAEAITAGALVATALAGILIERPGHDEAAT